MSQKFALIENLENLLPLAFTEDLPDITSEAICLSSENLMAKLIAKATGVICGIPLLPYIFQYRMSNISVTPMAHDGDVVQKGSQIAIIEGSALGILSSERIALNFIQRLSGIATLTRRFVTLLQGTGVTLLDTRKTTPGWRYLEKYATRVGGAKNNRMSASEAIMIKDNHLAVTKSLSKAVQRAREFYGEKVEIILEVKNLEELREALSLNVNRIMLDNFSLEDVKKAVQIVQKKVPLEVSGGINLQNVKDYAQTGIDFISVGAITHSAPALDISLEVS